MTWSMLFVSFGVLMLISSDILEALKADKLASRQIAVSWVWFALAFIFVMLERMD